MDSCWKDDYPSDLWKGNISPLLFAVNASPNNNNGGYKNEFEWFLQAMITSVKDQVDTSSSNHTTSSSSNLMDPLEALLSLDPTTLGTNSSSSTTTGGTESSNRNLLSRRISMMKSSSKSIGNQNSSSEFKEDEIFNNNNNNNYSTIPSNNNNTNNNVGLYHGTGLFFQTARVIPVSKKHAFPPSKDPTGTKNKKKIFQQQQQQQQQQQSSSPLMMGLGSRHGHSSSSSSSSSNNTTTTPTSSSLHGVSGERRIHSSTTTTNYYNRRNKNNNNNNNSRMMVESVDGILPQAWLEKHAHALPSVLLVVAVVELSSDVYHMAQIEQSLSQSCDALKSSLASKRECKLHLVLLTTTTTNNNDTLTTVQCNEKCDSIRTICRTSYFTTVPLPTIHKTSENENENPFLVVSNNTNKVMLQKIAKSLRDASLEYYLNQVRRAKRKHSLTEEQEEYQIRYCFKIATFYEFFNSEEKALKYYTQAYKSILDYYQYLTQTIGLSNILPTSTSNNLQLNRNRSSSLNSVNKLKTTTNDTLTSILSQTDEGDEQQPYDEEDDDDDDEETSYLPNNLISSSSPPPPTTTTTTTSHQESIEVTYNTPTLLSSPSQNHNYPPDILHQCRGTADWLNYKLLTFLLAIYQDITTLNSSEPTEPTDPLSIPTTKNTPTKTTTASVETVLMAYMTQCRRHSQTFFTKLSSSSSQRQEEEEEPSWHYWQYVCQQRMVMAYMGYQLFSSKQKLTYQTNAITQMMASCDSWKQYATLAENLLQLDSCLQKERKLNSSNTSNPQELLHDSSSIASTVHGWFVGSINDTELQIKLQEECAKNHKELALNCILRALKLWEDSTEGGPKNKKGSRLHYIAGHIYYQNEMYDKAENHYRQSKQLLSQWPCLQIAISRALLSCIEKKQKQQEEEKKDAQELSMSLLLNPRTSLLLPQQDLNQYTQNMFAQSKLATTNKYFECTSFVFAVTFPKYNSATAGNVVDALLTLQSNIPFRIEICDLILHTNMGPITVKAPGVMNFQQLVQVPFQMTLPTDLSSITVGESSDSIVKLNKSNASGLTYCGGGSVLFEEDTSEDRHLLLGGVVVSCTSLQITVRHSTTDPTNTVQMEVQNPFRGSLPLPDSAVKSAPVVLAKRTYFEEDNYISSAWACPEQFSLYAGPRCLRIHPPQPQLQVTDLTSKFASGKALEGTVNRIVLELQAVDEACYDMQFTVTCTSCYMQQSDLEKEEESTSTTKVQRRPILVQYHPGSTSTETELVDWKNLGEGNETDWRPIQSSLEKNQTCCTWFDLYRPLPTSPLNAMHSPLDQCDLEENINDIHCRTNYTIQVSHRTSGSSGVVVKKEFRGHVDWCQPLVVDTAIIPGNHSRYPSGNRHPTNQISQDNNSAKLGIPIAATDAVAVNDSSCLGVRLTASAKEPHFTILLEQITFNPNMAVSTKEEEKNEKNYTTTCDLRLMNNGSKTDKMESNILFAPTGKKNEFAHILKAHCKFGTTFFVQPQLMGESSNSGVLNCTTNLGVLEVSWKPKGYSLPPTTTLVSCDDPFKDCLGPLSMIQQIDPIKVYGPLCYIERAPFNASLSLIPTAPKVATPFEVAYTITNQTFVPQELSVTLSTQDTNGNVVLVSGLMTGPIHLGPKETSQLIYMILANSPGRMSLPCINVTSERHGTWIIRSNPDNSPRIFVMP